MTEVFLREREYMITKGMKDRKLPANNGKKETGWTIMEDQKMRATELLYSLITSSANANHMKTEKWLIARQNNYKSKLRDEQWGKS